MRRFARFSAAIFVGVIGHAVAATDSTLTGEGATPGKTNASTNAPAVSAPVSAPTTNAPAAQPPTPTTHVATLDPADLREFAAQPAPVQRVIASALDLTKQNLSYKYGSSDPKAGGMDCSGTIYFLLGQAGVKDVPRDASEMYRWVWTRSVFRAVVSPNPNTFELAPLKPGDLLFWTGTYRVDRDPPVTHVMIYLGISRHDDRRVMAGASEGRQYEGQSRYGVSVFDFTLPRQKEAATAETDAPQSRFIGYGAVPGLD